MEKIILRHYAFNEGRTGYTNGCDWTQNPYEPSATIAGNRKAHTEWFAGWAHQSDQPRTIGTIKTEMETKSRAAAVAFLLEHHNGEDQGACGFAWVTIVPTHKGNTKEGKAERVKFEALGAKFDVDLRSWYIWNPSKTPAQNVDAKEAGATAATVILRSHGFNAYAHSRLD